MKDYKTIEADSSEGLNHKINEYLKKGFLVIDAQYVIEGEQTKDSYVFCQNIVRTREAIVVAESKSLSKEPDFSRSGKMEIRRKVWDIISRIEGNFTSTSIYRLVRFWKSWADNAELNRFVTQEISNRIQRGEIEEVGRMGRGYKRICIRKRVG